MTTYAYAKIVSASRLAQEIDECGITVALDHITTSASGSDIVFKSSLNDSEKDTLDSLIEDHDPADITSYEEIIVLSQNTKSGAFETQKSPIVSGDGKVRVLASHKPVIPGKEAYNYFTSRGDAGTVIASGTAMRLETAVGQPITSVDIHFSTDTNPMEIVYLFGGGISWENAGWGDEISLELRTAPTAVVPSGIAVSMGLPVVYALDGERVKYAGPGQGTHALGGYPKWVPNFNKTGYWDLDKVAMAAVPASQTGEFDWYITEQFVGHYVNAMSVYKNNSQPIILDATEAAPLPHGMFIRVVAHNISNTVWKVWAFMKLYRERLK